MWLFYATDLSLGLCKYSGLFLYATLTAQSGGKAPRFDKGPAEQGTRVKRSGFDTQWQNPDSSGPPGKGIVFYN